MTHPTLPALLEPVRRACARDAATDLPRTDLVAAFLTGSTGLNTAREASPRSEMLRLNTAIAPTPAASQKRLGVLAGDIAGFPNGRRPGDDVVDIELTVAEGALSGTNGLQTCDLSGPTPKVKNAGVVVNDGAKPNPSDYATSFPYLATPIPGAP